MPTHDGQRYWEAIIDNHSTHKETGSSVKLPDDAHWEITEDKYTFTFDDSRKLEFEDTNKLTAQYFKILIENHGIEVKHKHVQTVIEGVTKQQIENLVKALRKKVGNAKLNNRISFKTEYKGGYKLLISSK
jgi:hypothetical protein